MKLPDEPDGYRDVEKYKEPVAGHQEQDGDDQLEPELGDVPEVETATAFLSIEIVALEVCKYQNIICHSLHVT